jgi:hypothetical protein
MQRYRDWFGVRFEFLIYDVTSTYFDGQIQDRGSAQDGREHLGALPLPHCYSSGGSSSGKSVRICAFNWERAYCLQAFDAGSGLELAVVFMTQKQVVRPTGFCSHCRHIRNALGNRRCQPGKENPTVAEG